MQTQPLRDPVPRRWLLHPPPISYPLPAERPRDLALATAPVDAASFGTLEEALAAVLCHAATGGTS